MERILTLQNLSKVEADALCADVGITTHPMSNRFGWNGSTLEFEGERCGEIVPAKTNRPLAIVLNLRRLPPSMAQIILKVTDEERVVG